MALANQFVEALSPADREAVLAVRSGLRFAATSC
jgi:hypothetical protein